MNRNSIDCRRASKSGRASTLCAMLLLLCATSLPAATVVEIRETADYLAISFEAEDYDTADERWVLTDPTTSALDISMDPDPNHSEDAVGNAYLELLPD